MKQAFLAGGFALLLGCATEKNAHSGSPPTSGATASTPATGAPVGATTIPPGTTSGTTTTPPAGCPPPLTVPPDLCDLAVANPAILDDYQPIDPTRARFCHTASGDDYLLVEDSVVICTNHGPHPMDLRPTCRC